MSDTIPAAAPLIRVGVFAAVLALTVLWEDRSA
jgi:hypothetical protein